jgi:carbon storage regulator
MLVLSRKEGERILIGDQIAITVVRINATTVRIGIDAPTRMIVVREELTGGAREPQPPGSTAPTAAAP